ncbi:MAG: SRPBCC family protein [Methanobacteriota archaeon]
MDVSAEVLIRRPRDAVARFAMEPENDTKWIGGIREVRVITDPPFGKGTQVERVASFRRRRIEYVLAVEEHDPRARLVMRSIKSPFPMRVTYDFDKAGEGTLARIRVEVDAGGFYRLAAPMISRSVRRSITNDLGTLKKLLESTGERA